MNAESIHWKLYALYYELIQLHQEAAGLFGPTDELTTEILGAAGHLNPYAVESLVKERG